ncbi:mannose 6-Phosphate Receptor [Thecamonas trahens ATCC 50062]|uniref:Mannose 6-Phosphate Receptor n=1 Tax=Thecamonas trahens ATCC 50062 TaxID=461836 RepID=A0A0L0DPM4_THETB|nr:mannose 6-Phosphate Receptor [Thecamonas trahens ATCC 50062]KNC54259.1 mannose 6-Phosphate Receptor [Thecamonas trahens ATCC 50062]|eukprot:XP_013753894.1 mannose 6-Phosphate Receptor [Thecamonas trahens ATCC 50062]
MRMVIVAAALLGMLLVQVAYGGKCDTYVNSNGYTFPLSKLKNEAPIIWKYNEPSPPPPPANNGPPPPPATEYTATFMICNVVDKCPSSHSLTPNPQPAACQSWVDEGSEKYRIMGQLQYTSITDGPLEDKSVVVTYENGDPCSTGVNRTIEITLLCDPEHSGELPKIVFDGEAEHCIYRFTLSSNKLGYCPTTYNPSAPPSSPSKHKGPSGGTILLIVAVVFAFVYLVGGCVYKRVVVGAVGLEMIPNVDFWRSLPGLVLDGFNFSLRRKSE